MTTHGKGGELPNANALERSRQAMQNQPAPRLPLGGRRCAYRHWPHTVPMRISLDHQGPSALRGGCAIALSADRFELTVIALDPP